MKEKIQADKISNATVFLFRFLSVLFSILAVISFFAAVLFAYKHFYGRFLMFGSYSVINLLFATGLWNMKKWIVSLFGIALGVALLVDILHVAQGTQSFFNAFVGLLIVSILFITTYSFRNNLKEKYFEYQPLIVFIGSLVAAQIAIVFWK